MGKSYRDNEIDSEGHVQDLLSAYIDKSLDETGRARVRAHLEGCADCRADLVELQATQRLLQSMPVAAVPRAFTLTPEMAAKARKTSLWERIFSPRLAPTFATGSVVAFLVLIFMLATLNSGMNAEQPQSVAFTPKIGATDTNRNSGEEGLTPMTLMAEPTATTGVGVAGDTDTANTGASAANPSEPPAPVPTAPPAAGGASSEAQVTPNTSIANSGALSPTTVPSGEALYSMKTPDNSPPGITGSEPYSAESAPVEARSAQEFNLQIAAEIGLLLVTIALAVAAVVAWRG